MYSNILKWIGFLTFLSANIFATECRIDLSGTYKVQGSYFATPNTVSGSWGTIRLVNKGDGNYLAYSKLKEYADPLQAGVLNLTAKEAELSNGGECVLEVVSRVKGNEVIPVNESGIVYQSFSGLTFEFPRTGCGGEGGTSSECGVYLYFNL